MYFLFDLNLTILVLFSWVAMFGKNNEETVGLLKVSAIQLDGNTKYGYLIEL